MIAFDELTSHPPQRGFGIPIANWNWNLVDSEQTAMGTTWTDQTFELVGTWNGSIFVLTQNPKPANEPLRKGIAPTPNCDPSRWVAMLPAVYKSNVGLLNAGDDRWDGRCGVRIHALVDTQQLRRALIPFGTAALVDFALNPVTK